MEKDILDLIKCIINIYDDNNNGDGYLSEYEVVILIKAILKLSEVKGKI